MISDGRISYEISFKDTEKAGIEKSNLEVRLPKEFIFLESDITPLNTTANYITWSFPATASGEEQKIKIDGIIFGKVNDEVILSASLSYKFDNVSSPFMSSNSYTSLVTKSLVDIVIEKPDSIEADKEFIYKIKIKNNGTRVLKNIGLDFSYHNYFDVLETSESPVKENKGEDMFFIFDLNKMVDENTVDKNTDEYYEKIITIKGIINNDKISEINFKIKLGIVEDSNDFDSTNYLIEKDDNFKLANSGFVFNVEPSIALEDYGDYKVALIKNINDPYKMSFEYNKIGDTYGYGSNNFKNVRINLELIGDNIIDSKNIKTSIKPTITTNEQNGIVDNVLEWNKDNTPGLANITTTENKIDLTLPFVKQIDLDKNDAKSIIANLNVYGFNDKNEEILLFKYPSFKILIDTNLTVTAGLKYYDDNNIQVGFGENPPKAGSETKYRVDFKINNVYDNLSNVVLSAKILNEAEYINEYVVDRGDDIKYDEASKTVTWNIGEIGRGDNVFGYFYIYLRPTTGDIGKKIKVIDEIQIRYKDSYLNKDVVKSFSAIESEKVR